MARETSIARRGFGRIERRKSGRYRAAYTGPDGRLYRAPTTFDAKDDAVAWLSARRAEIQMEVWAPDAAARGASRRTVPTMRAYGDQWLEGRKTRGRELRPTTRQQYRMLLDVHIYPTSSTSGSTGSRPRRSRSGRTRSRPARRRSALRPTACCAPSSARPHPPGRSR